MQTSIWHTTHAIDYPRLGMKWINLHAWCNYLVQLKDMAAGAKRIFLHPEHGNTVTDVVCIAEKELVVTSSLDRRVCVWQVNCRLSVTVFVPDIHELTLGLRK